MKLWPALLVALLAILVYALFLRFTTNRLIVTNTNVNVNYNSWPLQGTEPNSTTYSWQS